MASTFGTSREHLRHQIEEEGGPKTTREADGEYRRGSFNWWNCFIDRLFESLDYERLNAWLAIDEPADHEIGLRAFTLDACFAQDSLTLLHYVFLPRLIDFARGH
jgi:hypothetical protein